MQSQKSQPPKIDYSMLKNFEGVDLSNPRIAMDLISRVVFEHGLDRLPRMAIAMKIMEAGHLPTSVGSFSLQKVSAAFRRQRKELGHVLDELIRPSGNFTTNILGHERKGFDFYEMDFLLLRCTPFLLEEILGRT
ncbi:MAG: hypothetical protein WCX95_05235, partial [Candidatus Gracilibacteria bacterium]